VSPDAALGDEILELLDARRGHFLLESGHDGVTPEAFAEREGLALERLASLPNPLWEPSDFPFCAAGTPLAPA
jgi:hypothetical protein